MRKKIALQIVASNVGLAIHFALTVVLSRLLTPDDIGVFSMSAVLIAVAHVFRDFGVTTYIKRVKTLDDATVRTARTLLLMTSGAMALLMYFSAPACARFFNEPRVEEVVRVLALGFLFIPLGAIASAILTRETQVGKTAVATLVSSVVYFAASVWMAFNGFDHMTMAWANFINIIAHGLVANLLLGRRFDWRPSLRGWREMTNFGLGNVLTNLTRALNTALPDIALGRLSTPATVGLFSRANGTVTMMEKLLQPPINYFTLPQMARVHHAEGDVGAAYLRVSSIVQCLMFPALAWIAIVAPDLIGLLYGTQWIPAAAAVPWLCVAIGISTMFAMATPTLMGVGRPYAPMWPVASVVVAKLVAIAFLFDGSLERFALAIALGEVLGIPAYLWVLQRHTGMLWRHWFFLNMRLLLYLAPINAVVFMVGFGLQVQPAWLHLVVTATLSAVLHGLLYLWVDLPIREELNIMKKHIFPSKRSSHT